MNSKNQKKLLLKLLKEAGQAGVNRVYATENYYIVDVPTRIFELIHEDKIPIKKRTEKNRTATYYIAENTETQQATEWQF